MARSKIDPHTDARVAEALAWLKRRGTKKNREGMARYAIVAPKSFGVTMSNILQLGKRLGRDHALAAALWETGWYEARMLAAFVDEPDKVSAAQMDRWARDFDNWAVCDHQCFHLFDRTPCVAEDRTVEPPARGVREARRLCPARSRGAA